MSQQTDLSLLLNTLEQLGNYEFKDDAEQQHAERAVRKVADKLQKPYDRILEMCGGTSKDAALKFGVDVDLWRKWKDGKRVQTGDELAQLTESDPSLMNGLLKHLATWNIVEEVEPSTYCRTNFSDHLARDEFAGCINLQFEGFIPAFHKLPEYFRRHGYTRATDSKKSPFAYAMDFDGTFWDYCGVNPKLNECFILTMSGYNADRGTWLDAYPPGRIVDHLEEDYPLLVDVGGSSGHDVEKLRQLAPEKTNKRLVLQDQDFVIEKALGNLNSGITAMVHDFWTEQPVKRKSELFSHPFCAVVCCLIVNHVF
ncbi:MAG: hypothetical protein M1831_006835 [Alyxoria varia]|nr:MAG: hypothetical protein M1831_006835 [Alyxoria varia]